MPQPFLTAEWRNLIMANYEIDPAVLRPYLPYGTELDGYQNVHYVSLVGFLFANTRVMGVSFPFHRTFEEVNLRFYVRYQEGGTWKRGVVFIKEIVPRHLISFVAHTLYGENYATHRMKHSWTPTPEGLKVEYSWLYDNEWNYLSVVADKQAIPVAEGSEEEFITEHYWGCTFLNESCMGSYQVVHPRWKVYPVKSYAIHCQAEKLYGTGFAQALNGQPLSVFLAEGSPIAVMKGAKHIASVSP